MPYGLKAFLAFGIEALVLLIIVEAALSMAMALGARISPYHPVIRFLRSVVNPILNPVRRMLPPPSRTGGWDFSPLIVIIVLQTLGGAILRM